VKKLLVILFVLLAIFVAAGTWFYLNIDRPYKGYDAAEVFV
jgi:hypothetical protein